MTTITALHGTKSQTPFSTLLGSQAGYLGKGVYLTSDPHAALMSADDDPVNVLVVEATLNNPYRTQYNAEAETLINHASEVAGIWVELLGVDAARRMAAKHQDSLQLTDELQAALVPMGYDGIELDWGDGNVTWLVFDPASVFIKSYGLNNDQQDNAANHPPANRPQP